MPKLWRLRVEYVILLDLRATLLRLLSKESSYCPSGGPRGPPSAWHVHGDLLRLCISLPTTRLSVTSELGTRSSMMTRKPTVGGGAASSGACGPPSAWLVLRRLPWPRRFLAKAIRSPAPGAPVLEPLHLTPAPGATTGRLSIFLCLSLSFCL